MIASEQDKEREGDADAVGVNASTDQQQAAGTAGGVKVTHDHGTVRHSGKAALMAAIVANDVAAMPRAVGEGVGVIAALGDDDSTLLHLAAQLGHVASMKWLVASEQGADMHAKREVGSLAVGSTPLHYAAHIMGKWCQWNGLWGRVQMCMPRVGMATLPFTLQHFQGRWHH
jgi:hypothetical protein